MKPSNILVAIEEKDKWIERRKRLESELKKAVKEKKVILSQLLELKKEMKKYDDALIDLAFRDKLTGSSSIDPGSIK
jgi:chromosome segregation ATPase